MVLHRLDPIWAILICPTRRIWIVWIGHRLLHDRLSLSKLLFVTLVERKGLKWSWLVRRQDGSMSVRLVVIFLGKSAAAKYGYQEGGEEKSGHCAFSGVLTKIEVS